MTPPPAAAAAPAVRPRRSGASTRRAPAPPRRVSGPKSGSSPGKSTARVAPRGGAVALPAPGGLALGLIEALAGISQHRWLDRLIRGRAWIGLVAFALIGIVAMQLWVVKLGVGIGRALEHEGLLQRENATLSIEDAKLSSGERVEQLAAAKGMVVAAPGALHFDTAHGSLDARLAAAALAKSGQVQASSATESSSTTTGSEAPAGSATSTAETPAAAASTASTPAAGATAESATGTGATESSTSSTAGSTAESAPTSATAEGGSSATPASAENSGAAVSSTTSEASTPASAGTVGADGGTQQPAPGG